jgi:hypothetical protein
MSGKLAPLGIAIAGAVCDVRSGIENADMGMTSPMRQSSEMTMSSLIVQRQGLNSLASQAGRPHAASRVKDSAADPATRNASESSVSISPQAQALYAQSRAVKATAQGSALNAAPSERARGASVQPEISFDQFVERFIRMSREYYGNEDGGPISISKFAERAQRVLLDVSTRVQSRLEAAGFALEPPIEMAADGAGTGVRVGPHPLREKIQAVINGDESLNSEYRNALLMRANAAEWQRVEKAHLAYYAAHDAGRVDEAQRIIQALASAPRIEVIQRFGRSGVETSSRSS